MGKEVVKLLLQSCGQGDVIAVQREQGAAPGLLAGDIASSAVTERAQNSVASIVRDELVRLLGNDPEALAPLGIEAGPTNEASGSDIGPLSASGVSMVWVVIGRSRATS